LLYFASFKICLGISRVLKNDPQFQTNDWVNLAQVLIGFRANFHQQLMTETCDFKTQNHALIFYFSTVYPNFSHDAQDRAAFSEDLRSLELNPNRKGWVPPWKKSAFGAGIFLESLKADQSKITP